MTVEESGRTFDSLDLATLRRRHSAKWRLFDSDVIPASIAEMDFPLAAPISRELHRAAELGDTGYAWRSAGLAEAYAAFAERRWGWSVAPEEVVAVPDVLAGIAEFLRRTSAPGDRVVINTPAYPPYFDVLREVDRRLVEVPLATDEQGYHMDLEALRAAFAAGAVVFLLCNPHNPTGYVADPYELAAIGRLAERYGVTVLADEIWAPLTLRGRFVPYGGIAGHREHTITFSSATKAFNTAGLKCGLAITQSPRTRVLADGLPPEMPYRTSLLGVTTSEAAFAQGDAWLDELVDYLSGSHQLLAQLLTDLAPGIRYRPPAATYLAWLDCRALGLGDNPAAYLLERARVGLSPGPDFGTGGAGFARLNVATPRAVLTEIVRRIGKAVTG